MALTDTWLRAAKGMKKPYKKSDGGGLFILVQPDGKRHWRLAYRFGGKQKTLAFGSYPLVSLKEARDARDAAKKQLLSGQDPGAARKAEKAAVAAEAENRFETIAREWHAWKTRSLADHYAQQIMSRLEADVFPEIGARPIREIDAPELLEMLRKIEARGAHEMARRVKTHCSQIFRFAIVSPGRRASRDPCADLRGALEAAPAVAHRKAVSLDDLPQLLRDMDSYEGEAVTRLALKLVSLTMLRTRELRMGRWSEIKETGSRYAPVWEVPAERMKEKRQHLVPLSRQALETLAELRDITGYQEYLFPGGKPGQCMSNNTMLYALYRMGYHLRQTTHGFRGIASTILNEAGFKSDAIEKQLAHEERSKVRGAYNAAEYLAERREMLQWYADYLDRLRNDPGGNVIPLRRTA